MLLRRTLPTPPGGDGWTFGRIVQLVLTACIAVPAMARARLQLTSLLGEEISAFNQQSTSVGRDSQSGRADDAEFVERISWLLPRLARRLPWRGDCLVQAMAAQKLLLSRGIASSIVIGVENASDTGFGAHAWLRYGDQIVTGGEVGRYEILFEGR